MRQQGRTLVISQAVIDGVIGVSMFLAAYLLRFETSLETTGLETENLLPRQAHNF